MKKHRVFFNLILVLLCFLVIFGVLCGFCLLSALILCETLVVNPRDNRLSADGVRSVLFSIPGDGKCIQTLSGTPF